MTEHVRSGTVNPGFLGDRPVAAPAPVTPVARPPEATGLVGEDGGGRSRDVARATPHGKVIAQRREDRNGSRLPPVLQRLDLAVAQRALDQQRALAHVTPLQRERL